LIGCKKNGVESFKAGDWAGFPFGGMTILYDNMNISFKSWITNKIPYSLREPVASLEERKENV